MAPGYSNPLHLLAFDHRGEPVRGLIAGTTERSAAAGQIADDYLETVNGFVV